MHLTTSDLQAAIQQREWERALIERQNRMLRAASMPLPPRSFAAKLIDIGRRSRAIEAAQAESGTANVAAA
jgi:hypothetical protein